MTTTFPITKQTGFAGISIPGLPTDASTFPTSHLRLDKVAVVAESITEEEEAEEREWDTIISNPHVRNALRRMAAEARRQYYAGETEEGGFGLE